MTRSPENRGPCPECFREIGVLKEFTGLYRENARPAGYRVSVHNRCPEGGRCPGSRREISRELITFGRTRP